MGLDWECPSPPRQGRTARSLGALLSAPAAGGSASREERLCPVSVFPCSVCKRRLPGKLASCYWAWFNADGGRSAWKLRYCPGCAVEALSPLLKRTQSAAESQEVFACISCGGSAEGDSDPMYATLYLPGKEPTEYALQLCGACAAKLRIPIVDDGARLPDRNGVVRGPSPPISAWDALGLEPE